MFTISCNILTLCVFSQILFYTSPVHPIVSTMLAVFSLMPGEYCWGLKLSYSCYTMILIGYYRIYDIYTMGIKKPWSVGFGGERSSDGHLKHE